MYLNNCWILNRMCNRRWLQQKTDFNKWTLNRKNLMIKATPCGNLNKYTDQFTLSLFELRCHCCYIVVRCFLLFSCVQHRLMSIEHIRIQMSLIPLYGFVFCPLNCTAREQSNKRVPSNGWKKKMNQSKVFFVARESARMNALSFSRSFFLPYTHSKWMICSIFDDNNRACMALKNEPHIIIKKFGFFWSTHT